MTSYKIDLVGTVFWLFCGYSLYTALVTFFRADNWGLMVFQNLRQPLIVSLYFIVPCIALYVLRLTFDYIPTNIFWITTLGIIGLSFFLMLYILAVPDWPVGRFTQIHKVPLFLIRFLLSVNFAMTLLVTVMCCYVLVRVPNQVRKNHGPEIVELETHAEEAKEDQRQTQNQIKTIREDTTAKILKEGMDLLKTAITLAGTMATVYTSFKVLQKDRPTEANQQPRQHEERREQNPPPNQP